MSGPSGRGRDGRDGAAAAASLGLAVGAVVVGVAVLVDDQRRRAGRHQPVAERLGQQLRLQHVLRRSGGEHAPGQQQHAIGPPGLPQVVRRHHHRRPRRGLGGDDLEDPLLAGEVETGDRLVEQQQVGRRGEGLGDEDPLALTAGQLPERAAAEVVDVEAVGRALDGRAVRRPEPAEQAPLGVATHAQHVLDAERHPPVLVLLLGDERDPQPLGDGQRAGRRSHQPGEQPEQSALAAAVRPDEGRRRAGFDRQRARSEGDDGAVVHAHVGRGDDETRSVDDVDRPEDRTFAHQRDEL